MKIARELALDTSESVARMKEGKCPIVGSGPYSAAITRAHLNNLLINLKPMPRTQNCEKSNKVTERAMQTAKRFHGAGVMMRDPRY